MDHKLKLRSSALSLAAVFYAGRLRLAGGQRIFVPAGRGRSR